MLNTMRTLEPHRRPVTVINPDTFCTPYPNIVVDTNAGLLTIPPAMVKEPVAPSTIIDKYHNRK